MNRTPLSSFFIGTITLLCWPLFGLAEAIQIKPYRAAYVTNYQFLLPMSGQAVRELLPEENGLWRLNHRVESPMIKITETSLFSWTGTHAEPISYYYQQSALAKKREVDLRFDWKQLVAVNSADEQPITIQLPERAQDKLTYQLQLREDLLRQGTPGTYQVVDRKRIKAYQFEVLAEEQINVPAGVFNTVKLRRLRDKGDARQTYVWLAKDWDYFLVQIQQHEKGKSYDIMLSEGELDGKPIQGLAE